MAIDPDCFVGREKFKKEMDRYIQTIKESKKAENAAEILMPGEPEYRTETKRLKEGIPLPPATIKELLTLGESFGIPLPMMDR
jgi:LDH2 family malate/lactate/ureidoglycolate dehydrogenase